MKHLITMLFLICLAVNANAQQLSGTVKDVDTKGPIAFVSIRVKGSNMGTVTNEQGEFSINITLPATLVISHLSYGQKEIEVIDGTLLSVALKQEPTQLPEVTVGDPALAI